MADEREARLYKIGEVCRMADVQPYVLRYWETEFAPLAPGKSGGGQRLYTQREIDLILRIKQLLYSEGFTIAGAKKKLEAELNAPATAADPAAASAPTAAAPATNAPSPTAAADDRTKEALRQMKRELAAILELLEE